MDRGFAEATDVYLQVTSEQASSIAHASMTASCPRGVVVASPWLWIGWTRWSWWSTWGHELSVAASAERPDCLHFQCSSRPRMRTVLVDFGRNRRAARRLAGVVHRQAEPFAISTSVSDE